jgi:putative tryptophan/tyrosine transport system substrate-binding protein
MKRRAFIAALGGAAVWPLVAAGQQPGRIYRIGILTTDYPGDRANSVIFRFVPALARLGYIEGRNLEILWRGVAGDVSKLPMLAQELIGAQVELIVAAGLPSIKAAKESTSRIPIVMGYTGDDPVAAGLAATLNRPGGNVTGVSFLGSQADAKRFELLAGAFGQLKHLGQLTDPVFSADRLQLVQHVANAMGVELTFIRAANRDDYDNAFAEARRIGVKALAISTNPVYNRDRFDLAKRALAAGLPTICAVREMAEAGCLMSYGQNNDVLFGRVADYVVRILNGANPAELPIEQTTTFELVLNLKVAKALGITMPTSILLRADEVIE